MEILQKGYSVTVVLAVLTFGLVITHSLSAPHILLFLLYYFLLGIDEGMGKWWNWSLVPRKGACLAHYRLILEA